MPFTLRFPNRDPNKPRLSIRERLRNTAAKILPRSSKEHKKGGGSDTTRRALVAASLVAGVVGIKAAPVQTESNPDAALLDLGWRYLALWQERETFVEKVLSPAEERVSQADPWQMPEACFVRAGDQTLLGLPYPKMTLDGRRFYDMGLIEELRSTSRTMWTHRHGTNHTVDGTVEYAVRRTPNLEAQARADEIVQAYDEARARRERIQHETGFTEVNKRYLAMGAVLDELERQILALAARTLAGLCIKAQCAVRMEGGATFDDAITRNVEKVDDLVTVEAMALSIARDFVAMQEGRA